ncbi:MAG: MATE family efflux transporter [Planctomycetes bacterium]|nr:MATE family efflux transporter [Planctomycetota bacterium]
MPADAPRPLHVLALPLVASFTLRFAFGMVDLVYAGYLPDSRAAVAAIAFYIPFQEIYVATWVGLSAGYTAALSAAFGRRDQAAVARLQRSMRRLLYAIVPALSLLGGAVWFAVPWFGLEDALTRAFRVYGTTMLIGMPLTGFWSIHPDSIVKAHHDTRSTMVAGMSATLTNVALNSTFVFVFGWGLFGIAVATVVSRLVALAYSSWRARALEATRLAEADWSQDGAATEPRGPLLEIVTLGLPSTLTYALTAAEGGLVNRLLTSAEESTVAIASYGVFYNLQRLALMPTVACAVAVLPFVARLVPAGHHAQVARDLRRVALLAAAFALAFTLPAGVLFPSEVGAFFLSDADASSLDAPLTRSLLRLLPLSTLAMLPFLLLRPVFEALRRPRLGVRLTVLRFVVFAWPALLGGFWLAGHAGIPRPVGLVAGFVVAGALGSLATVTLVARSLRAAAQT